MYPIFRGGGRGGGAGIWGLGEKPSNTFLVDILFVLGLCFIFLFHINQFSLFFSAIL